MCVGSELTTDSFRPHKKLNGVVSTLQHKSLLLLLRVN